MPSNTTGDEFGGVSVPNPLAKGSVGTMGAETPRELLARGEPRGSNMPSPISSIADAFLSASSAMSSLDECLRSVRRPANTGEEDKDMDGDVVGKGGEGECCPRHTDAGDAVSGRLEDKNSVSRSWRRSGTVMPGGRLKSGRGMRLYAADVVRTELVVGRLELAVPAVAPRFGNLISGSDGRLLVMPAWSKEESGMLGCCSNRLLGCPPLESSIAASWAGLLLVG
jgi:hypothetical protein